MNNIHCKFKYKCPNKWEALKSTASTDVKFCDHCNENVYWAYTQAQYDKYASEGKCVALETAEMTVLGKCLAVDKKDIIQ